MGKVRLIGLIAFASGCVLIAPVSFAQGPIQVVKDYGVGNLLGGLVQVADGSFYGVLGDDGNNFPPPPSSSIFRLLKDGTSQTVFQFPVDGSRGRNPNALTQASDANLYGTTNSGGLANRGVLFRLSLGAGYQVIHVFTGVDGADPVGRLTQGLDGKLYGTTSGGGASGKGTVFRTDLAGNIEVLFSFSGQNGSFPIGNLVYRGDTFYGTTILGGTSGVGTAYRFTPGLRLTVLHQFDNSAGCPNPLTLRNDGKLYGITAGTAFNRTAFCFADSDFGTLFSLDPATGAYQELHRFGSAPTDGAFPTGALLAASDGKLYGSTEIGGPSLFSVGSFFSFTPTPGSVPSSVYFGGTNQGGSPCCELLQSIGGDIYGVTQGFISIEGNSPDSVVYKAAPSLPAPAPVIQGFRPGKGPAGTTVFLAGDHFLGTAKVTFNGVPAQFVVTSTGSMFASVPVGATTGLITVINLGGVSQSSAVFTVE